MEDMRRQGIGSLHQHVFPCMSVLRSFEHKRCTWQEGDEEYDPTAADDEFAEANAAGLPQAAAEEEEEAEFDEAAIEDEERKERTLMAGAPQQLAQSR